MACLVRYMNAACVWDFDVTCPKHNMLYQSWVFSRVQQTTSLSNCASVKPHFPPPNVSCPKCLFNEFLKLCTAQKSMYSYVYVHHSECNNRQTTSTTNFFFSLKMSARVNSLYYIRICLVLSMLELSHCHHSCDSTESLKVQTVHDKGLSSGKITDCTHLTLTPSS